MAIIITGVAGFIGSNLASKFLLQGQNVIGIDNLSRGSLANLSTFVDAPGFTFILGDLTRPDELGHEVLRVCPDSVIDSIWHFAANSDISAGNEDIGVDLKDTFESTLGVLALSSRFKVKDIFFSSTSAIYGDAGDIAIEEDYGPLLPVSNYGAMKLASEAVLSAAAELNDYRLIIFRFPNVIGVPATHGVIFDFINKLNSDSEMLNVLGDGTQQKIYLHVSELIDAMIFLSKCEMMTKVDIINIGPMDDGASVKFIAESVVRVISPKAQIKYGLEGRGWIGDVPRFRYSINKLIQLGWRPAMSSEEAVQLAILQIKKQLSDD